MGNTLNPLSYLSYNKDSNEEEKEDKEEKEEDNFPQGTKYEEELNRTFKYFNIFWYDPNKSNDFDSFKKCFENVLFYKGYDLESITNFFEKESNSEWIVITPGSQGQELIHNLERFDCIKSFFIYCWNIEIHEQWANKIKKVGCITSDPEILCQKFIELNKDYTIPNYNYQFEKYESNFDVLSNINKIQTENKFALTSVKREIQSLIEKTSKIKNKYNNFLIKSLNYLKGNEIEKDFQETIIDDKSPFYLYVKLFKENGKEYFQSVINYIKNISLLSLYFSQYPYLLNLLSFNEVKELFKVKITPDLVYSRQKNLLNILDNLSQKLMKGEYILEYKNELKEVQIYCIYYIINRAIEVNKNNNNIINNYQIINLFREIDFCLKVLITMEYSNFNNKNKKFVDEINFIIMTTEPRYIIYLGYTEPIFKNIINDAYQKKVNETLTIKDFIIIGDKKFHENIKKIEKDIKAKSIKYLQIEQISNYINEKNNNDDDIKTYFCFLIIKLEDFQQNLEKLILLSAETGITFIALIYIENENKSIPFYKNQINLVMSTILVYSPDDILGYLSQNLNFHYNEKYLEALNDICSIKIPNISFEQKDEEKYDNGCFELAETFDINLIKNKTVLSFNDNIEYTEEFRQNIYYIYKEHNALDLFYNQNCIYFGWQLYPELFYLNICFVDFYDGV